MSDIKYIRRKPPRMTSIQHSARIESKNKELVSTLEKFFGKKMNLARIKFLGLFIISLCKVQTVNFEKLATGFEATTKRSSSLRRIQRFMAEYVLDTDLIARRVFALLPHLIKN